MTTRRNTRTQTGQSAPRSNSERADSRDQIYRMVTDQIVDLLKAGTVPWHKPWNDFGGMPRSLSTHKPYRGVNPFILSMTAMAHSYSSPLWGTFDKIAGMDGVDTRDRAAVNAWGGLRGQKATKIVFWKTLPITGVNAETGQPETKIIPFLRYFNVFNVDQVTWRTRETPTFGGGARLNQFERIEAAEKIVSGYPNPPALATGSDAFYTYANDTITMPPFDSFDSAEEYYSTRFHEMAHSTGADKRLKRNGVASGTYGPFGSAPYSEEELTAELTAAMLAALAELETVRTLPNSAAYLASWIKQLGDDPKLIVMAAARAQKAVDHILGVTYDGSDSTEE